LGVVIDEQGELMGALCNEWAEAQMVEQGQRIRELEAQLAQRADIPFAYVVLHAEDDNEWPSPKKLMLVRQTLREVVSDPYLRQRCKYPDCQHLEIIEVYPGGRMNSLSLDCYANSPRSRRHVHWTWREDVNA
jgi:hypothetical protein